MPLSSSIFMKQEYFNLIYQPIDWLHGYLHICLPVQIKRTKTPKAIPFLSDDNHDWPIFLLIYWQFVPRNGIHFISNSTIALCDVMSQMTCNIYHNHRCHRWSKFVQCRQEIAIIIRLSWNSFFYLICSI